MNRKEGIVKLNERKCCQVVTGSVNMLNGAAILMNGVGTLNGVYAIFLVSQ